MNSKVSLVFQILAFLASGMVAIGGSYLAVQRSLDARPTREQVETAGDVRWAARAKVEAMEATVAAQSQQLQSIHTDVREIRQEVRELRGDLRRGGR